MPEYEIPFHIQEEIMKRLPVKSLIQFRSVSKAWKSLIDTSEFIAAHTLLSHTQPQHLLVSNEDMCKMDYILFCHSYIDDHTFPQQRSVLTLPPLSPQQIIRPSVVGSSHGLVCLYGHQPEYKAGTTLLWNPSIRKYIVVATPVKPDAIGFGVCPVTNDPKMVLIYQSFWDKLEASCTYEVMVYTLSLGEWKSLSINFPTKQFQVLWSAVATDRFIYWEAVFPTHSMILSFDVTNEIVELIDLPPSLACYRGGVDISQIRESLAILENRENTSTVWMMEHGAQRSFTKLFAIKTPHEFIVGFRKSGIPIVHYDDDDEQLGKLVVYEPNSEHNNVLEIFSPLHFLYVNSYMETLILLGRSDCISC